MAGYGAKKAHRPQSWISIIKLFKPVLASDIVYRFRLLPKRNKTEQNHNNLFSAIKNSLKYFYL